MQNFVLSPFLSTVISVFLLMGCYELGRLLVEKFTLKNGLKVIVHQDNTSPIVAFNLLYDVGARDEDEVCDDRPVPCRR